MFIFIGHPRICHRGNIRTSDSSCYPGINRPHISTILISGNLGAVKNKHWKQDSSLEVHPSGQLNGDVHCPVLVRINLWIWVEFAQCVLCCTLKRIVWLMRLSLLCHTLSQTVKKTDMLSLEKMGETFVLNSQSFFWCHRVIFCHCCWVYKTYSATFCFNFQSGRPLLCCRTRWDLFRCI